jgi:hypothetical protein
MKKVARTDYVRLGATVKLTRFQNECGLKYGKPARESLFERTVLTLPKKRTGPTRLQGPSGGSVARRRPMGMRNPHPQRSAFVVRSRAIRRWPCQAAKGLAELLSGPRKGPGRHYRYELVRGESGELEFQIDELDVFSMA